MLLHVGRETWEQVVLRKFLAHVADVKSVEFVALLRLPLLPRHLLDRNSPSESGLDHHGSILLLLLLRRRRPCVSFLAAPKNVHHLAVDAFLIIDRRRERALLLLLRLVGRPAVEL